MITNVDKRQQIVKFLWQPVLVHGPEKWLHDKERAAYLVKSKAVISVIQSPGVAVTVDCPIADA